MHVEYGPPWARGQWRSVIDSLEFLVIRRHGADSDAVNVIHCPII
jgi:hypothetical protein